MPPEVPIFVSLPVHSKNASSSTLYRVMMNKVSNERSCCAAQSEMRIYSKNLTEGVAFLNQKLQTAKKGLRSHFKGSIGDDFCAERSSAFSRDRIPMPLSNSL
jgi:hypothetical protein